VRGWALVAAFVIGAAAVADQPHLISQSHFGAFEASLTASGHGFAAAWYDTRDGHPEIYMRLLDADGRPTGAERRLTNGRSAAYEADIAALGQNLVVAWYERGSTGTSRAMLGGWTREGRRLWLRTLSAPGRFGRNPVVRTTDREIFCAWLEYDGDRSPDVWAQWFDLEGRPRASPQRVAPAGRTTWNLNAAIDDRGMAWVAFDATVGTVADELFLAHVDHAASGSIRLTEDDGKPSKYPDLGFGADRAALTWFDERDGNKEVYLFVAPMAQMKEGLERRAVRVTDTPGESIGAYLAWNQQRVGLAWCDNTVGQHEIYFETFGTDGRALEAPRRLTDNKTESLIPAIRPAGHGFALVWNELTPGAGGGHDPSSRSEIAFALVR